MEGGVVRERTLERWVERVDRAARLLASRLDEPPSLAELAAEAAISSFHFHRIWRALTGETVSQSLARLRIEAGKDLLAGDSSVTEAASALGFGTPQSFARAFRRQTGQTPTEWRRAPSTGGLSAATEHPLVEIVRRDEVTVVAIRREGSPYADLNATFGQLWAWADGASLLGNLRGIYGLPLDDPESVAVSELRYIAALDVGPAAPPQPFSLLQLNGGSYARLRHSGSYNGLHDSTQWLVGHWLPRSGEEPEDAPVLHHFLNDPDVTPEALLLTDILLPLKMRKEQS